MGGEWTVAHLRSVQAGGISRRSVLLGAATTVAVASIPRYARPQAQTPANPLASWNDGPAKQAVLEFVRATTDQASNNFVTPEDRIATFDQDGTLWVEHPGYGQAMFALDRVRELAPQHPEWQNQEPFKSVLSNDPAAVGKFTESDWLDIVGATLAGMNEREYAEIVGHWIETAKHPRFNRLYTELVYQPMLEMPMARSFVDHRWDSPRKLGFAPDSPLEGEGFEPSVPRQRINAFRDCKVRAMADNPACRRASRQIGRRSLQPRDRWFADSPLEERRF
jgi:hypothetical protein